jgi:superfamily I DNA/RNA helicase
MSRTPGRRWSSIAVLTRTNAQLVAVKAAMDAALVPSRVAGSDLGPASDLRAAADRDSAERIPSSRTGRGATGVDADDVLDDRTTSFVDDPATQDHVVLTTFHRAKGLQWPTVLVLGLGAGLMPIASAQTEAAIDEERRLLYVALTRSEDELYCSWFERAGDDLGGLARKPSPWLAPIEETVARLEKEAAPTSASEVSARVAELRQRLVDGSEGADVTR